MNDKFSEEINLIEENRQLKKDLRFFRLWLIVALAMFLITVFINTCSYNKGYKRGRQDLFDQVNEELKKQKR